RRRGEAELGRRPDGRRGLPAGPGQAPDSRRRARLGAARGGRAVVIVMRAGSGRDDADRVASRIRSTGTLAHVATSRGRLVVSCECSAGNPVEEGLRGDPAVVDVLHVARPYQLASRELQPSDTVVRLANGTSIGG